MAEIVWLQMCLRHIPLNWPCENMVFSTVLPILLAEGLQFSLYDFQLESTRDGKCVGWMRKTSGQQCLDPIPGTNVPPSLVE